jgi:hypothetical protein
MDWVLRVHSLQQAPTQSLPFHAYGCPLLDSCLLSRPFLGVRVPFFAATVLDGLGLASDEYAAVNSVCYGDPFESCQHAGVADNISDLRIPAEEGFSGRCTSISGTPPSRFIIRDGTEKQQARTDAAGVPQQFCNDTVHALRARQLQAESYSNIPASQDPVYGTIASSTVQAVHSDQLTPDQLLELQSLVEKFKDQISWTPDDIGVLTDKYSSYYMSIPTQEGATCKQKPYRLSHREFQVFKEQIAMLLEQGVIKKADGPTDFLSPVLFVPKPRKPNELRMCIDFRRLNAVSKRDFHALPHIRDLLQSMSGCKYFTALDLTWGFWALPIVERDQHKTAFTGPDGEIYVWTKAPMGLSNSPASFQRLMAHVMQGIPGVSVYIDDITVFLSLIHI